MAIQILIISEDKPPFEKGMIVTALEEPVTWGRKECLPIFCKVHISDGTKSEASIYSQPWMTDLRFEVVGNQMTVSINPKIVEFTNYRLNIDTWLSYKDFTPVLTNDFTCVFNFNGDPDSIISEIKDICETQVAPSPYIIPAENVDNIIASGGYVERTKEYAESIIIDRRT